MKKQSLYYISLRKIEVVNKEYEIKAESEEEALTKVVELVGEPAFIEVNEITKANIKTY